MSQNLLWTKQSNDFVKEVNSYHKNITREYILPNGKKKKAFLTSDADYVIGFAVTADLKKTILVKEYRPGPERLIIDLPCGTINKGENPLDAMAREFLEETGYIGDIEFVSETFTGPYSTQKRFTHLIRNCKKVSVQKLDHDEFIEVVELPIDEFVNDYVLPGKTINTAAAIFALNYLKAVKIKV